MRVERKRGMIRTADSSAPRSDTPGGLQSTEALSAHGFRVLRVVGTLDEPTSRPINLEPTQNLVVLSVQGTLLYRSRHPEKTGLLSRESCLFCSSARNLALHYARGHHEWLEFEWANDRFLALSDYVADYAGPSPHPAFAAKSLLGSRAISHENLLALSASLNQDWSTVSTNVMAFVHEVVGALFAEPGNGLLASIPPEANDVIRDLMQAVKEDPTQSWSLKEAAEIAGYSAFHLSRTFRTLTGFGFPEFVDRCRAEQAIKLLLHTEEPIDEVGKKCGFGSTQALRGACKEYTGLLPSEMRHLPTARVSYSSH